MIEPNANRTLIESLARESARSVADVVNLYEREYSSLAESARITSFIPLLAMRRVRYQLLDAPSTRQAH